MRLAISFIALFMLALSLHAASPDSTCQANYCYGSDSPQSVGLVLSGGGAKGIAHIGVIQALEENDIPIDYIAGTSMGAVVGGLYAAGYTPAEMMELIKSPGFAHWSTGKIDRNLTYYFSQNDPTPAFAEIPVGLRPKGEKSSPMSLLPASLISPLPMNYAFMELFSAYTAQCGSDFNHLFVPFRCVCSDVYHKHKVVLRSGSLGDAVRASMSFPTVFRPIAIDSLLMYDGGIYDNFPVDVMRSEFAPSIMIGVNVSGPDSKPIPDDLFQQLEDMIIQNNDYSLPDDEGIKMDVPVRMFGLLAFDRADEIYRIGYETAVAMMDSIKARVNARIPQSSRAIARNVFKANTPYVRFDSVEVHGGSHAQNDYIRYLFTHNRRDTIGLSGARESYYRALTPGRLSNLLPQANHNDSTGMFTLSLEATPKRNFNIGAGGYVSSSTSSMLFLSAGYNTLSFNSTEANVNGWIGQSYMALAANAKMSLRTHIPSRLHLQAAAHRHRFYENDKLFFDDSQPVFITKSEVFARLNFEWAVGQRGKASIGAGWGRLSDKFFPNDADFKESSRDVATQNLGQALARYDYSTLDNLSFPTDGASFHASAMGILGNYRFTPADDSTPTRQRRHWWQASVKADKYFDTSRHFSLGVALSALWSSRTLSENYYASVVDAPAFNPTPSSYNTFNTALRAYRFATAGVIPVWKISSMVQLRGSFHLFMPMQSIKEDSYGHAHYGQWLADPEFTGEIAAVVNFPFASLSAYGNYSSSPARNWNFGISFGIFILAPSFLD